MAEEQLQLSFEDLVSEVAIITQRKKKKPSGSTLSAKDFALIEHKKVLNQLTPKKLTLKNSVYGNLYIPLEVIEQMLSALFTAHYITLPFMPKYMKGQVLHVVNIHVLHPVLNEWLIYSGEACVPLIAADQNNMKWNHRNIPAGKGFAIINAAKEIGQIFRPEKHELSNVMRDYFSDKQQESVPVSEEDKAKEEMKKRLLKLIPTSKTVTSLKKKEEKMKELDDAEVNEAYNNKMEELTNKKK